MSSSYTERQAILCRSCPKNIGILRHIAWYCRQVVLHIGLWVYLNYYILRFFGAPHPVLRDGYRLSAPLALFFQFRKPSRPINHLCS